jgi:RHS repeat-associated protein
MLDYYGNGNISSQNINGDYKGNFSDTKEIRVSYTYDNSNRLIDAEPFSRQYFDLKGTYTYDADGNFSVLTRSYNGDGFNYEYYTGTNRLKKVTGESDQFTYDYNGNLINDYFNNNTDIKYDHRNLITEITRVDDLIDPPATYTTTYKYDEAGNRTNKTVTKDDGSTMEIIVNEYYIRDVSGKEIAIYQNDTLKFWNVWGLGNEGRITADGIRYYYIKDHLGSIRAVLNDNNELVEAIDYDPWGHIARYWTSTPSKYKFTGKERDNETGYDYFGARYYDSRIGNWTSTDPLFEKHIRWSPYNYVLRNPMILIDPDGEQIVVVFSGAGFLKAGQEISQLDYSLSSSTGAENLLYHLKSYYEEIGISTSKIKGYYSSMGILGEKTEIEEAFNFIINNLEENEQLFLYGYSQGGENIIELSDKLNEKKIKVTDLFTVDAFQAMAGVEYHYISENVKRNWNYYQEKPDPNPFSQARGTLNFAKNKEKTKVINKKIKNISHTEIDEYTIPNVTRIIKDRVYK